MVRTIVIDPLPAGSTLRRFAYPIRGVGEVVEDASAAEWQRHHLQLDESHGSGDRRDVDKAPLLQSIGQVPRRFVFDSPDFMADSDGDRVAARLGIAATVDDSGLPADPVIIGFSPGREQELVEWSGGSVLVDHLNALGAAFRHRQGNDGLHEPRRLR